MSYAETKGGASALIWTLIGLVVGIAVGWWYADYPTYLLFGTVLGWMTGLALSDAGASEH